MAEDFIPRKEFEERMREVTAGFDAKVNATQSQLSEAMGMLKVNQGQLSELINNQSKQQEATTKLDKAVAISTTMNKYLWPTVTALVSVVTALATIVATGVHL